MLLFFILSRNPSYFYAFLGSILSLELPKLTPSFFNLHSPPVYRFNKGKEACWNIEKWSLIIDFLIVN